MEIKRKILNKKNLTKRSNLNILNIDEKLNPIKV